MAVTHVDLTHRLDASIDYATKGKPHVNDEYIQGKRALEINSVNASCDPKEFKQETHSFLKHNVMNRKGTYTGIRTIISFDPKQLDYRKLSDRHTALAVGTWIAKHKYPHNQSLIVLQADNKHHILHDHIVTCARRLDNNHSSTSGATFEMTVPFTNEAERHYKLTPYDIKKYDQHASPSHSVYRISQRNEYSFIQEVHAQIINCLRKSHTPYEFQQNLQKHNIQVRQAYKMRTNKKTHKHEYHFYKYPSGKGTYLSLDQPTINTLYKTDFKIAKNSHLQEHKGDFLRCRKHFTYIFRNEHGKRKVIRDRKLGSDTSPNYINKVLKENGQEIEYIPDNPSNNGNNLHKSKGFKYILADLQPKHKVLTCHKYSVTETNDKVYKYDKDDKKYIGYPRLSLHNTGEYKQPVMTFHPKTHDISKALNEVISGLNRIAKATQAGSAERQRQLNMFYSQCEFKKEEAKKIEANEENKEAFYKVQSDNQAIAEQCAEANRDYERILKYNQAHYQGPTLF